jgi:hypothetical protein
MKREEALHLMAVLKVTGRSVVFEVAHLLLHLIVILPRLRSASRKAQSGSFHQSQTTTKSQYSMRRTYLPPATFFPHGCSLFHLLHTHIINLASLRVSSQVSTSYTCYRSPLSHWPVSDPLLSGFFVIPRLFLAQPSLAVKHPILALLPQQRLRYSSLRKVSL